MHETSDGRRTRTLSRLLLIAAAGALLPAGSCEDNLGDIEPGPVAFRASVGTGNLQAQGSSNFPSTTRDGRYFAFGSTARNLALPSSAFQEVFVRDRLLDTVRNATRLSRLGSLSDIYLSDCIEPSISPNGQLLVFLSKGILSPTIDTTTIPTPPVNPGVQATYSAYFFDLTQDPSLDPSFWFTPVLGTDRWPDADIKNVSIADNGLVAFETASTNVPRLGFPDYATGGSDHVFVWNAFVGGPTITLISHVMGGPPETPANGQSRWPRISGDGSFVAFTSTSNNLTADPNNGRQQIYLSASNGSSMEFISRASGVAGATSDEHCVRPVPNIDGSVVAFQVQNNVVGPGTLIPGVDAVLTARRNRAAVPPQTELVGIDPFIFSFGGPGDGIPTTISDDGQFVGYMRINAAQTDLDVIVRDMAGGGEFKASFTMIPASGTLLEFPQMMISGDGRWVFWSSETEVQVLGDNNNASDIFGFGPMR